MRRTICGLVVLAVLGACGDRLTLTSAPGSMISLFARLDTGGGQPNGFNVLFTYDPKQGCLDLSSSARATVNGVDVPDFFRGGAPVWDPWAPYCENPGFFVPLAMLDAPETTLAFEDGDERALMVIQSLNSAAAIAVAPPPDGHIRAGSTLGLSWTPPTDDISGMHAEITMVEQDGTKVSVSLGLGSFQGTSGQVTLPSPLPPGPATLRILGARTPMVLRCEGAVSCESKYWMVDEDLPVPFRAPSVPLEIEP